MDTTTPDAPATQEEVDAAAPTRPRRRLRRMGTIAVLVATVVATLGLTSGTASAASFTTPALYCYDGSVKVDPGVRSWYGTSDGYYRITVYKYTWAGWQAIRTAQGRTSYNQMVMPGQVGFANVGSGYYASRVERWNAQNGRWVRLTPVAAQRVNPYSQQPTGVTVCQLY